MRKLKRGLIALLVAVVLFGALMMIASESGEVVVLATTDGSGVVHETRLWVVEHDGAQWLRAGVPSASWLERLRERPEVSVVRGGVRRRYRAIPNADAGLRDRIHELVAEKYGWSESVIRLMRDGSASVPVRLEATE